MVADEPTVVQIDSDADLDALVERMPELEHGRVVVSVHDDSTTLITAAEFSKLLSAARQADVSLAISTNDHLRRELARMLGWAVADRPTSLGESWQGTGRGDDEQHSTADLATYAPSRIPTPSNAGAPRRRETQTGTVVLDRDEAMARAHERTRTREGQPLIGPRLTVPPSGARPHQTGERVEEPEPNDRRRRIAMWTVAIVAPLIVLALVGGILVYVLPTATITLVPKEHRIGADLTYGLPANGVSYDLAIEPTAIANTSTVDKTIAATGERFEPDGTASGTIVFTNPSLSAIAIPANTRMVGTNGLTYVTTKDVTVPASDPYGAGTFGAITAPISAATAGPSGNTGVGTIVGQLDSGVYYTNQEAVAGGSRKRILVVSPADIEALTIQAKEDITGRAMQEFNQKIGGNDKLVPGSVKQGEPQFEFSHKAGEDATEISVHGTLEVTGQVFDPTSLTAKAKDEVGRKLVGQTGSDTILLGNTMSVGDPEPLNDDQTAFKLHAEATVRSVISDQERADLASQIMGKDLEEANRIVSAMPDVASHTIDEGPTWLPRRIPQMLSHIDVVIDEGNDGGQAQTGP